MAIGMTPEAAIQTFLSGFGMPAYATASVPDMAEFPYISYDLSIGDWYEEANLTANVWFKTTGEATPNAKVREIGRAIGHGGVTLPCDGGMIWVKKGSPWAQAMTIEGEAENVKRRYLNITLEYMTTD
jgi:hypothetical protein